MTRNIDVKVLIETKMTVEVEPQIIDDEEVYTAEQVKKAVEESIFSYPLSLDEIEIQDIEY